MGWLRIVGCLKIYVSLQNIGLFCRSLLQKRPIFLSILLIVATPYWDLTKETRTSIPRNSTHDYTQCHITTHNAIHNVTSSNEMPHNIGCTLGFDKGDKSKYTNAKRLIKGFKALKHDQCIGVYVCVCVHVYGCACACARKSGSLGLFCKRDLVIESLLNACQRICSSARCLNINTCIYRHICIYIYTYIYMIENLLVVAAFSSRA